MLDVFELFAGELLNGDFLPSRCNPVHRVHGASLGHLALGLFASLDRYMRIGLVGLGMRPAASRRPSLVRWRSSARQRALPEPSLLPLEVSFWACELQLYETRWLWARLPLPTVTTRQQVLSGATSCSWIGLSIAELFGDLAPLPDRQLDA